MSARTLDAIRAIVAGGDDADTALRRTIEALAREPGVVWAGLAFLENGELRLGPTAGTQDESRRVRVPVSYEGETVGELSIDGVTEPGALEQVAELVSPYVLIGWDTGGEPWEP